MKGLRMAKIVPQILNVGVYFPSKGCDHNQRGKGACHQGNISDCGQSIVQFGGDDMTGICLCMDIANFWHLSQQF